MFWEEVVQDSAGIGGLPVFISIMIIALIVGQKDLSFQLFAGLSICYIIAVLTRIVWHKERPKPEKYSNIIEQIDAGSFPSIHSARAGLLTVVLGLFFNSLFLWILFGLLTLLVAWSRVYRKRHYPVDAFAGVVLGLAVGWVVSLLPIFI